MERESDKETQMKEKIMITEFGDKWVIRDKNAITYRKIQPH